MNDFLYSKFNLQIDRNIKYLFKLYSCLLNNDLIYLNYKQLYKKWKKLNKYLSKNEYETIKKQLYDMYSIYDVYMKNLINVLEDKYKDDEHKYMILEQFEQIMYIQNMKHKCEFDIFIKYCRELEIFNENIINKFEILIDECVDYKFIKA